MKPEGDFTPPGGIVDYVEGKQWLLGFHILNTASVFTALHISLGVHSCLLNVVDQGDGAGMCFIHS